MNLRKQTPHAPSRPAIFHFESDVEFSTRPNLSEGERNTGEGVMYNDEVSSQFFTTPFWSILHMMRVKEDGADLFRLWRQE